MGALSILLALLALLFLGAGLLTAIVPVVGSVFAFGAPVLALAGVILGGAAMSQASRAGRASGTGLAGVILNALAIIPALMIASTCGVCNACLSVAGLDMAKRDVRFVVGRGQDPGSMRKATKARDKAEEDTRPRADDPPDPHSPPPVFPPPPLQPGPATRPQQGR